MLLTVELCSKQAILTNHLVLARHNNLVHTQIVHMLVFHYTKSSKLIINARLLLITHVNLPTSTLCMMSFVASAYMHVVCAKTALI